ncbi:hypothetical protein G9C85_05375 [Halorubellus sp. JP-L1]|uniref:DUF6663 family protein n=1 Tax=Halorubellus sp. JP-L1 TaxID=2715753 RepID=UPI001407F115|nr:DUF6663 family protein [Halorubellus sp. JP-L1]NHN41067.1 hypothetical protein [Halorubellus sp. JP-L1]
MQESTETFRVYESAHRDGGVTFASVPADPTSDDPGAYELTAVALDGHAAAGVDALEPGNVVSASLSWQTEPPTVTALEVVRETRFWFAREVTGLFEAATETWATAKRRGEGVNSRVTRNTDGEENGALYAFAEQPGGRDLFAEFRSGERPLDPLLARVDAGDRDGGPRDVFVLDPVDERCVVVYVALNRDGMLASTVRDTYDVE